MGTPVKGGVQLFPEEAIYLLETGSAAISDTRNREMSILEGFSVLESYRIDMFKYETYKMLKTLGFVVLRPRKSTISYELNYFPMHGNCHYNRERNPSGSIQIAHSTIPSQSIPFPELFPTFVKKRNKWTMQMREIHDNPKFVNFLESDTFQGFDTAKVVSKLKLPTQNRKRDRQCRPARWPKCQNSRKAGNWEEYRGLREKEMRKGKRGYRFQPPMDIRRQNCTVDNVDYHVFSPASFSHYLPARPLFSLICLGSRHEPLEVSQLSRMRNVILAIEEVGKVNFVSISGQPIDLFSFLHS